MTLTKTTDYLFYIYLFWIVVVANLVVTPSIALAIEGVLFFFILFLTTIEEKFKFLDRIVLQYIFSFFFFLFLGGLISGASVDYLIFGIQISLCFGVFLFLTTRDNLDQFFSIYAFSGLFLGVCAFVDWVSGNNIFFNAGRLNIFLENANATGYFFSTLIFICLHSLTKPFNIFAAFFCFFILLLSGSFGAIIATILGFGIINILSRKLIVVGIFFLPLITIIFFLQISNIAEYLIDSPMRAFNRVGLVMLLNESGTLSIDDVGSASERRHLSEESIKYILNQWHLNIFWGRGLDFFPDSNFPAHAHNGWIRLWYANGLLSAFIYAVPFHLVIIACILLKKPLYVATAVVILVFWYTTPVIYLRSSAFPILVFWAYTFKYTEVARRNWAAC